MNTNNQRCSDRISTCTHFRIPALRIIADTEQIRSTDIETSTVYSHILCPVFRKCITQGYILKTEIGTIKHPVAGSGIVVIFAHIGQTWILSTRILCISVERTPVLAFNDCWHIAKIVSEWLHHRLVKISILLANSLESNVQIDALP